MPKFPRRFAPSSPGSSPGPRVRTAVPSMVVPQFSAQAETAVARGVAGLGGGLSDVGQGLLAREAREAREARREDKARRAREALNARHQRANNLLDSEEAYQDYQGALDATFAELSETHPRTLGQELQTQGQDLIEQYGDTLLDARARQRFETKAQAGLNALARKAHGLEVASRKQQAAAVIFAFQDDQVDKMLAASSTLELAEVRTATTKFVTDPDTIDIMGGKAAAALEQAIETIYTQATLRRDMHLNPEETVKRLREKAEQGTLQIGGIPIDEWLTEAKGVRRQFFADRSAADTRAEVEQAAAEEATALQLTTSYNTLHATPQNLEEFEKALVEANALALAGDLDPKDFQRIENDLTSRIRMALQPPVTQNDPDVERRLRLAVLAIESPDDGRRVQAEILAEQVRLRPDLVMQLHNDAGLRRLSTHYSNIDLVQEGRVILRRPFFPSGVYLSGALPEPVQKQLLLAENEYDQVMAAAGTEERIREIALSEAYRIQQKYFQPQLAPKLPPRFNPYANELYRDNTFVIQEIAREAVKKGWSKSEQNAVKQQWDAVYKIYLLDVAAREKSENK